MREKAGNWGFKNETSPPKTIPACGSGRCRAAGRIVDREGADLSVATDHHCRTVPSGRRDRHCLAHARRRHEGTARSDHSGRERHRGQRHHRFRPGRACRTRWLYAGHRPMEQPCRRRRALRLPYHVLHDFEPISVLTTSPLWILGKNDLPAKDLKELIAWLKANPDKASVATVGAGSASHMCMVYFQDATGTRFQYVPYRGAAPVMQDLIAGQVDLSCLEAGQTLANYSAGKFRVFAVMAKQRFFPAPDVPTVDEAGTPGLHFPFWHGMWAPKGTPKPVIASLNAAVAAAFTDPATQRRFRDVGMELPSREQQTPEALYAHHKAEIDKWWPIIRAANIKAE